MLLDRAEAYDPDLDGISLFQLYCGFAKQAFWFRQILFWFVTPKSKFLSAVVPFDNMVRGVHRNNVNKATDRNISRTQSLSRDVVSVQVTLSYFTFVNNESYLSTDRLGLSNVVLVKLPYFSLGSVNIFTSFSIDHQKPAWFCLAK